MSGLVSFSLFGLDQDRVYYSGAIKNAKMYNEEFPDWHLWFYVGSSVPDYILSEIKQKNSNAHFEFVDEPEDQTATWWRFRAIKHSTHDSIVFRDVDSRPWPRETAAVREWLRGDYPYHTMRDHQMHGAVLLAGMWGLKKSVYGAHYKLPDTITIAQGERHYGIDQINLQRWIWPICKRQVMAHIGSFQCIYEKPIQRRPFRVPRTASEPFVAQGLDAEDKPRFPGHELMVDSDAELKQHRDIFLDQYRF